jgi:hypothetical protein
VRDPEIWPVNVDVSEIKKNERSSFRWLVVLASRIVNDPRGEISMIRPNVWNHVDNGKSQMGPMEG